MPLTPFDIPFLLPGNPSPYSLEPSLHLLGNSSFVSWREFPSTPFPGWLCTDPPPFSPFPFPAPNGSPCLMHALSGRHCDNGFMQSDTSRASAWLKVSFGKSKRVYSQCPEASALKIFSKKK